MEERRAERLGSATHTKQHPTSLPRGWPLPEPVYRGQMGSTAAPSPGDELSRRTAVVLAGHTGEIAIVRGHIHDLDASVRSAAVSALARLGELTGDDLLRALNDIGTARRAIELAASAALGNTAVDDRLVSYANGGNDDLAELAVWALGERWQERGDDSRCTDVLDALERLARHHDDALVREAAVASLGAIGAERSVPIIIAAASDKATVRRRAVIALAPFDGPEVEAALLSAKNDRDWQVRQAAEDLLAPNP